MFKKIKKYIADAFKSRALILSAAFVLLAVVLIQRLFQLQIINGESYLTDFTMQIKKERTLSSTRGSILDSEGNPLAYNKLAYSVTFEDNGTYDSTKERNLTLNSIMYGLLQVIEGNGDSILMDFGIDLDGAGNYTFTKEGVNLQRFKADIYGRVYIEDMTNSERDATAEEMMEDMCGKDMYGILDPQYTESELQEYGLPAQLTKEETLKLAIMRSRVAQNSYQKYITTTLAKDVSEQTMTQVMENKDIYQGADVIEESIRVYEDSVYFAPLLGYTGQISSEEMEELNAEDEDRYQSSDIVGKVGLEKTFESELQGVRGSETVYVNNLGKVLKEDARTEPQAGNNIQLTINRELQIAAYQILEQYIAGIVYSNMIDSMEFDVDNISSSDEIRIPVYDVYYALFENNVLDASHLAAEDASAIEQRVYQSFLSKEESVFAQIKQELTSSNPTAYQDLSDEMQAYMSYVVDNVLMEGTGILNEDAIDKTDATYKAWTTDESISLQEYLTYALSQNWIDITKIDLESEYLDSNEIYNALADYISDYLSKDDNFSRRVYKYMIKEGSVSGTEVCLLLFDQGILEMNETDYNALSNGTVNPYDFIRSKIYNLEITPAQLALEPFSGSVVITDPDSGDVLACVTYPGYDNNRLANDMDSEYYTKLNNDKTSPFYNKATQEVTAPGSTFKMVSATAGVMEGVISTVDTITCKGKFDLVDTPINCWIYSDSLGYGAHGAETLTTAIRDSCNFYFNTVGYMLGLDGENYDDSQGISRLRKYAQMYGLDSKTGIEIDETAPHISESDAPRTAMGQSDNAYTTSQLARYVNTVANSGTCYDLTLLDKITDSAGNTLQEKEPVVHNKLDLPSDLWNSIHSGMNQVVQNNESTKELSTTYHFEAAGKTGTAEESKRRANHALFVGYAPYEEPEISIAVRITNGYKSGNAAAVAKDIFKYYFDLEDEKEIIDGTATEVSASNATAD